MERPFDRDERPRGLNPFVLKKFENDILFNDVSFKYENSNKTSLANINVNIYNNIHEEN